MGNILWFDAAGIVPCTPSASSEETDSPAVRMGVVGGRFERPWRSTSTGGQSLTFSFAGSQSIVGFALYNFNAPSIVINGVTYVVSQDFDAMGKLFVITAFSASSVSVSIPGSQTTFDAATSYKIGRLFFLTGVHEVEQCPETISREIHDPQITVDSELGVYDTLPTGSQYATETWGGRWLTEELPNIKTLMQRRAHQWVGLFRNYLDRDYELTFYHKVGGVRLSYGGNLAVNIDATFRQAC